MLGKINESKKMKEKCENDKENNEEKCIYVLIEIIFVLLSKKKMLQNPLTPSFLRNSLTLEVFMFVVQW